MKKNPNILLILVIILCIMPQQAKTQETLLFYDFENTWTDGVNPADWSASFNIKLQTQLFPIPIIMNFGKKNSSSPYSGNYDLQISPYYFVGIPGTLPAFTIPGVVQLGKNREITIPLSAITDLINNGLDFSDPEALFEFGGAFAGLMSPGVPVRGNISELKAFIRYLPAQEDTSTITVVTSRWDNNLRTKIVVAEGTAVIVDSDSAYREISIPLTVLEEDLVADTVFVVIVVGGLNANPNTKLFIDNISLIGFPVSVAKNEPLQYAIYPNPASEKISIIPANSHLPYSIKLFDLSGKLVLENMSLINSAFLDVKGITKGIYLLELTQGYEKYRQKIIIQ